MGAMWVGFPNCPIGQKREGKINSLKLVVSFHRSVLNLVANGGSYTQGRIAGDFPSSRKAARAERYPPKTTAAALDG